MMAVGPGDQLYRRALESQAAYTVVAVEGELVEVEVVLAPGLVAGQRLKFTARDVQAMEQIPAPQQEQHNASGPVLGAEPAARQRSM